MLKLDADGMCVSHPIRPSRMRTLERGPMRSVLGIVIHQTSSPTLQSTLNSYMHGDAYGAHFLIDRDGTIYQTASLLQRTAHVGPLRMRCLAEYRCTPAEIKASQKLGVKAQHQQEMAKSVPNRYPSNAEAIGIEIVGEALPRGTQVREDRKVYEAVSAAQNASVRWLVQELSSTYGVPMREVFRHPEVSRKNPTEASTAQW